MSRLRKPHEKAGPETTRAPQEAGFPGLRNHPSSPPPLCPPDLHLCPREGSLPGSTSAGWGLGLGRGLENSSELQLTPLPLRTGRESTSVPGKPVSAASTSESSLPMFHMPSRRHRGSHRNENRSSSFSFLWSLCVFAASASHSSHRGHRTASGCPRLPPTHTPLTPPCDLVGSFLPSSPSLIPCSQHSFILVCHPHHGPSMCLLAGHPTQTTSNPMSQ